VSDAALERAPRVSVVVPTYCRRDYLFEALESLLAQSYTSFEVIVGNDGGPAYIEPVKRRFADERIVWIDHKERLGLLGNMLDGFARARGSFLATLHDDDRWDPEFLATSVPLLEGDERLSVVTSSSIRMGGSTPSEASRARRRGAGTG
jgi:glycosyltransferase involved in cell wall biosynthesis